MPTAIVAVPIISLERDRDVVEQRVRLRLEQHAASDGLTLTSDVRRGADLTLDGVPCATFEADAAWPTLSEPYEPPEPNLGGR